MHFTHDERKKKSSNAFVSENKPVIIIAIKLLGGKKRTKTLNNEFR